MSDETLVPTTEPVKRKPGRPRKNPVDAAPPADDIELLKARLAAAEAALAAAGQKSPVVSADGRFSAFFDRSSMKQVGNQTMNVTDHFTDPEDPGLQKLVDEGKRGYCQIAYPDGRPCRGFETSAMAAQATMRSCRDGKFNPDPVVKMSKKQDLMAPVPVKAEA